MAGCVLAVSVKVSSGPSKHRLEIDSPSASLASRYACRAASDESKTSLPMPTCWAPCPGNSHATDTGARYHEAPGKGIVHSRVRGIMAHRGWLCRTGLLGVVVLVLASTACDRADRSADDDDGGRRSRKARRGGEQRSDKKVMRELKSWIQRAQQSIYVDGDEDAYWAIYADSAQVVHARGEDLHPYDYVIPAKRSRDYAKTRDAMGKVPPLKGYTQKYEGETAKLEDDKGDRSLECAHHLGAGRQGVRSRATSSVTR